MDGRENSPGSPANGAQIRPPAAAVREPPSCNVAGPLVNGREPLYI